MAGADGSGSRGRPKGHLDSRSDIEMTAESEDIGSDSTSIAQPLFAS
jgi:hypothetical protein